MPKEYDFTESQMDEYNTMKPIILKESPNLAKSITDSYKHQNEKETKLKYIRQKIQAQKMEECTFRPKTNRNIPNRNLEQFLQAQQHHLEKIDRNKALLQLKLEEQALRNATFSPRINKGSHTSRVHNEKKEWKPEYVSSHTPKICEKSARMKRSKPVGQLLYEDAQRRNRQPEAPRHEEATIQPVQNRQINNKYAASKFIKEYLSVLQHLQIQQSADLSYELFNQILLNMGYLKHSKQSSNNTLAIQENNLLHQLYQYLSQSQQNAQYLCVFLLAINGIFDVQLDRVVLSNLQGRKIQIYFDMLYRNRLTFIRPKKDEQTSKDEMRMPRVSQETSELAEKYRKKMISRVNSIFEQNEIGVILPNQSQLTHEDLLVIHSIGRSMELENIREKKNSRVDPECTFKPLLSSTVRSSIINSPQHNVIKNYALLSNHLSSLKDNNKHSQKQFTNQNRSPLTSSSNNNFFQKKPKTSVEVSQPLHATKSNSSNINNQNSIKRSKILTNNNVTSFRDIRDIDKAVLRMREGRQIKKRKDQFLNRGEPQTDRHKSKKMISQKTCVGKAPFLVVDINIEEQINHLYFYPGDQKHINSIVQTFCEERGIKEENKMIIKEMVHKEITQVMK